MTRNPRPVRELPCSVATCRVLTRADLLVDASERGPFLGLVCPQCDDDLTAEEHAESGEPCRCDACTRVGERLERRALARFAEAVGGLHEATRELFGTRALLEERCSNDSE